MTHSDLLKTFQWHCLNKKFIYLQQRKPSTLSSMNWLIRIRKGLTRTKVERKELWSNIIRTPLWTVLLMPRKHWSSHISTSKICTLESVPWVSELGRFDCMLSRKETHRRSNSSVAKHHRFWNSPQIQPWLFGHVTHNNEIRRSCDNQTNLTHKFRQHWSLGKQ